MTASLLLLPDDPRLSELLQAWPEFQTRFPAYPRSKWLSAFEDVLREFYPSANSDSITLTARHHAPFPLAAGHDVP